MSFIIDDDRKHHPRLTGTTSLTLQQVLFATEEQAAYLGLLDATVAFLRAKPNFRHFTANLRDAWSELEGGRQ